MDLDATLDTAQGSSAQPLAATSSSSSSIRTSARVRAARERLEQQQQQHQQQLQTQPLATDQITTNHLTNRKGKKAAPSDSIARPRRSLAAQPLTINEPVPDRKGKKRALPSDDELSSEEDDEEDEEEDKVTQANPPSRVRQPPAKRLKTSASSYSLRTRSKKAMDPKQTAKKASSSNDAGPSHNADEDVEMGFQSDTHPEEIQIKAEETSSSLSKADPDAPSTSTLPVSMSTDTNESSNTNANPTDTIIAETSSSDPSSSVEPPPVPAPADPEPIPESSSSPDPIPVTAEPPLSSLMDGDFQFGAYMASLGPRLKTLLNNIKADADPTVRLLALQDLSEILSMSTEDNLNGYFSQDSFVKELVRIMGGKPTENENENEENVDEGDSDEGDGDGNLPNEANNDANANANANAEPTANAEGTPADNAAEATTATTGDNAVEAANAPEVATAEATAPASTAPDASTSDPALPASEQAAPEPSVVEQNVPAPAPIVPEEAVPEPIVPEPIVVDQVTPEQAVPVAVVPEQSVPVPVPVPEQPVPVPEQASPEQAPPEPVLPEVVPSEVAPLEPVPSEPVPPEPAVQEQPAVEQAVPVSVPIDIDPVAMGFGLGMGMDIGMGIDPEDEDAALAAALAMSAGDAGIDLGGFGGNLAQPEENLEEQLLACRCLANLMEAMPGSAHTLVYHGAVPVLCSKLQQITFIDLAEQTISTLEKLSEEYPSAIVRENGLSALLNYLDFFSTHVQRTALQAAANCCRNMSSDSYPMIKDVFPTIRNVLTYSDQRLVELASMCVIRTIESFARSLPNELEALIKGDLVRSINALLVPQSAGGGAGASQMITPNTATLFLRSLSSAAKSSPNITVTLLESGIENTLYAFLTGVLPPNHAQQEELEGNLAGVEGEVGMGGQGVGSGVVDMAVMQNLAGRPKDQVEEALGLISELMPPLPRDGVFDPRGYTEKSVSRAIKAKVKEAKGDGKGSSKSSAPSASTSTGEATTTESASNEVPIKTELAPQEVEMANMLLIPESDMATPATPANEATTSEAGQDVVMQINAPVEPVAENVEMQDAETVAVTQDTTASENPIVPEVPSFNPALTNAEGEPLMAMMMDDTPSGSQDQANGDSSQSNAPPEVPAEVIAAVAGSGSSHRHRHGESSTTHARLQLLREKPAVVSRFLYLIVPVLFDVYSASVTLQVRMRCFTGILKATSFVEGVGMETLYRNVPVASFIGSILTSRDNPLLVTNALQLVELLLIKSPSVFRNSLRKEGVLHEVSTISKIELKVKAKPTPVEGGENGEGTNDDGSAPPPPRKTSSIPSDPQDAYVLRARLIKVKYLTSGSDVGGDPVFDSLKAMIKVLTDPEADEEQLGGTLKDIAKLFGSSVVAISSFELLKSGLVDGLLDFATATGRKVDIEKRKDLILDAFSARSGYATPSSQSPMAVLVKRLQESLTRMETFDVVTTSPGSMEDAKRSSMALISRTLRLKLVAEDQTEVPKSCQNLMVSIHAIAPFSALDEYLKPRIAGVLPFRPELTPGLLQALAGTGLPSSALAQSVLSRIAGRSAGSSAGGFGSLFGALTGNPSSSVIASTNSLPPFTSSSTSSPIPIPSRRRTTGTGLGEQASSSEPTTAPETSTSEGTGVSRRRSLRLRGQPPESADATAATTTAPVVNEPAASTSAPVSSSTSPSVQNPSALASSLLHQLLVDDAEMDDGLDDEIGEDVDQLVPERAYNLAFDAAGRDLMASTPHGTRIATPLPGSTPGGAETPIAALAATNAAKKPSYADAANTAIEKATDFHLEFRLDGELLPMEMTVYGACHQYEARRSSDGQPNPHAVWNGNYTITYRKIPGKRPVQEAAKDDALMETDIVAGLAPDSPSSKILRLLRVLYRLNSEGVEHVDSNMKIVTIPDTAFINNKLTAKLARQLEEIMILASNCLPEWAMDLPQGFGFLFPFSTRYLFLQSTSFGYARLLNRVISQSPREVANNSRREGLEQYGRLQRRKVEVPRDSPMQVALKVFDLFGPSSSILDVHFQGEVGTGLGPTLEFFASVCREFAWRELKLWRDADSTLPGKYIHHPLGLFPAPMLNEVVDGPGATERDRRRIRLYRLLGQFVARALLDSRIIDISFNKIFVKLILGDHIPLTVSSLKLVDPTLGNSLATLQQFAKLKKAIDADETLKKGEKNKRIANLEVNGVKLDDMCLDFTAPGYDDLELKPNGKNITVTAKNVEEYIELVLDAILGRGTRPAVDAFKNGFSTVFSVTDLRTFSAEELIMMFGNSDEDWSAETLSEAVKADHGFNVESKAIRDLIDIMTSYDKNGRRDFLQFITGSPKLPIGGFKALNPQLTVVRKPHEAPLTPDDYLPSVMTCAHYLKLPSYSSRDVMEKKLMIAMREGTGSFHLS